MDGIHEYGGSLQPLHSGVILRDGERYPVSSCFSSSHDSSLATPHPPLPYSPCPLRSPLSAIRCSCPDTRLPPPLTSNRTLLHATTRSARYLLGSTASSLRRGLILPSLASQLRWPTISCPPLPRCVDGGHAVWCPGERQPLYRAELHRRWTPLLHRCVLEVSRRGNLLKRLHGHIGARIRGSGGCAHFEIILTRACQNGISCSQGAVLAYLTQRGTWIAAVGLTRGLNIWHLLIENRATGCDCHVAFVQCRVARPCAAAINCT